MVLENHPSNIYIFYGDDSIYQNKIIESNIVLKCDDSWAGLQEKSIELWKFASSNKLLQTYSHFFVVDFDEIFFHGKEIFKKLRDLENFFNNKPIYNFKSNFLNLTIDDCDYLSYKVFNANYQKGKGIPYQTSYYHFGKLDKNNRYSKTPLDAKKFPFAGGSGTLFSLKSFRILNRFTSKEKNKSFIKSFFMGFAEDTLSGYILNKNKIKPTIFDFDLFLVNINNYFPSVDKIFKDLIIEGKDIKSSQEISIFKNNFAQFDSINYLTDIECAQNLVKLLKSLEIDEKSMEFLFLELIVFIHKKDSKRFKEKINMIIENDLLKNKYHYPNLLLVSGMIVKKGSLDFFSPMRDLLDTYFPECNIKFFFKIKILQKNKDFDGLYKVLEQIKDNQIADAESLKTDLIRYLINNCFDGKLKDYLSFKNNSFSSDVVCLEYHIKNNDSKKSLEEFNLINPKYPNQTIIKNRKSILVAKLNNRPEICFDACKSNPFNDLENEEVKAKQVIYLCKNGFASKCKHFISFKNDSFEIRYAQFLYYEYISKHALAIDIMNSFIPSLDKEKCKKYFLLSRIFLNRDKEKAKKYALMYSSLTEKIFENDKKMIERKNTYMQKFI